MKKNKENDEIMKYYSLTNILKCNAEYNMIIGERSNGKTYAVLDYALKDYCKNGYQLGLIRRYNEDFTGQRGQQMFAALVENGLVEKYTNGEWTGISYYASRWYLSKYDEKLDKIIRKAEPFAFGFYLSGVEHDKSTSYPKIRTILFDECLTRERYLNDEFILFTNTLSTIIRERDGVKIFMCGNTVNKYAPYFKEMGLANVFKMEQGTIDVYSYGEEAELKVAVEYCKNNARGKKSNKYFAFNNPKLKMITTGAWELALYPHLPIKYKNHNVRFTYYIDFDGILLTCQIIDVKDNGKRLYFTYITRKTTPLKNKKGDIVYTKDYNPQVEYRRKLTKPIYKIDRTLYTFFVNDKVFYQDNEVGEVVRNYLMWSQQDKGII